MVFALVSTAPFQAQASLVTNGSFETGNFVSDGQGAMQLASGSSTLTGWTVFNDLVSWIKGPAFDLTAPEGQCFLDLTEDQLRAPFGGVRQDIATTVGATYRVSFQLGSDQQYGLPAGLTVAAGATTQAFSTSAAGPNAWTTYTTDFVATGTSSTLSFLGSQGQNYIGLDNVSVNAMNAVPLPGTLALVGLGLARRKAA